MFISTVIVYRQFLNAGASLKKTFSLPPASMQQGAASSGFSGHVAYLSAGLYEQPEALHVARHAGQARRT